jgi:hypothetical protein
LSVGTITDKCTVVAVVALGARLGSRSFIKSYNPQSLVLVVYGGS